MHDRPGPEQLFAEATMALDAGLAPGFAQKVAANALAIAARERELGPAQAAAEMERLAGLVGSEGGLAERNRRLADAIRSGAIAADDARLLDHLIRTTIAKLEVDQPNYPAFQQSCLANGS